MDEEEGSHYDEERFIWEEGDITWIVAPGSPHQKARRKYKPLNELLSSADDDHIRMTFADLETLLGDELPDSARSDQSWWGDAPGNYHAEAWVEPGRRVDEVDLVGERVAFGRSVPESQPLDGTS